MNVPKNLLYAKTHEWVKLDGDTALVGLTDHAQKSLGDLVFVNLPNVGDAVDAGDVLCDVESVKAVSDIYSPVSGTVEAVNEELADHPELVNSDAYGAWFARISGASAGSELMDADAYEAFIASEEEA